jgi:hypothetical protein
MQTENHEKKMRSPLLSNPVRDRCRSCKKPIIWAITEKNRRIPLDPEPVADGNILLTPRGNFLAPLATVRFAVQLDNPLRYKSHFATCPNAAQHRRKR